MKKTLFAVWVLLLCVFGCNEGDGLTVYYDLEYSGQAVYYEDNAPVENAQIIVLAGFPYNKITGGRAAVCDTFYTDVRGNYHPKFLQRIGNDYVIYYWIDVTTHDTASVEWIKGDEIKYGSLYLPVDSVTKPEYVLPTAHVVR